MRNAINVFLVLVSAGLAFWSYPYLPEKVPMHWNIDGEVDSYQPKAEAVWFMPVLIAVMWAMFQILPKLDPKRKNYAAFSAEWEVLQLAFLSFSVYLQAVIVYASLNPSVKSGPLMFLGMGAMFITIGKIMPKIKQNYFVGIRLPWTIANEDNWKKTHTFGGMCFMAAGILFLTGAMGGLLPAKAFFGLLMLTIAMPVAYSFWLFNRAKK